MIELRAVSTRYGKRDILNDIDLSITPGQIVGIVGPNGAGKSTLLHVIAGTLTPDVGEVALDGDALSSVSLLQQARRRAVMSQQITMAFAYRVHEVIAMGWEPFRELEPLEIELLRQVAETCGVQHLLQRRFDQLSGGERQRVQFARTSLQVEGITKQAHNGYWLLDEPTASLDIGFELAVLRQLRAVAVRGVGIGVVLHDLEKAARFCDVVALLNEGTMVAVGAPREVLTDTTLTRVYRTPIDIEWHEQRGRLLIHA
ncbi:MAG: heme ABC transporter ATP-binding protein [Pseudomonadota bacterium]